MYSCSWRFTSRRCVADAVLDRHFKGNPPGSCIENTFVKRQIILLPTSYRGTWGNLVPSTKPSKKNKEKKKNPSCTRIISCLWKQLSRVWLSDLQILRIRRILTIDEQARWICRRAHAPASYIMLHTQDRDKVYNSRRNSAACVYATSKRDSALIHWTVGTSNLSPYVCSRLLGLEENAACSNLLSLQTSSSRNESCV